MFRLTTFGRPTLVDAGDLPVQLGRQPLALLALLAVLGEEGVGRATLLQYLWGDDSRDSRHSLDQLLSLLRKRTRRDIFVGTDPVRLEAAALQTDVVDFLEAVRAGDTCAPSTSTRPRF
jgi:DNA-binding SARP family transcriptional activator